MTEYNATDKNKPETDPRYDLIDVDEVARMCGIGKTLCKKLYSMAMTPEPIKLGRLVRWRRSDIYSWIEAGCPSREKWLVMRGDRPKKR